MSAHLPARLRRVAALFGLGVAASGIAPVSPVSAESSPPPQIAPFDALYEIRDAAAACNDALRDATELAKMQDDAFWTSLAHARSSATLAFSLSRGAYWPRELRHVRRGIERRIVRCVSKLSLLEVSSAGARAARRANLVLRQQAPRIQRANTMLAMLLAPAVPPGPVPPPPPPPTPAPPGTIPTLVGGGGFTAATPQPDVVGTGPGADAKAIARWDVVPYQTFATKVPVGVVAFHIAGIECVDFSLNDGPWTRVTEMTQNPLTNVWEYSAYVDPATLTDGLVEVRAIVRPKKGIARLLAGPLDEGPAAKGRGEHSLFLYANAQGTLPSRSVWADAVGGDDTTGDGTEAKPYKSLNHAYYAASKAIADVSGLTVYLKPGDYAWAASWEGLKENSQYVTVAGAPGQPRTAARITAVDQDHNRGLDARRVCISNLTVDTVTLGSETRGCMIWTDGCELHSYGLSAYPAIFMEAHWGLGIWLTRPIIHDMGNATGEYRFMRDYELYNIGEAAVRDLCGMAINGTLRDFRFSRPDAHCDVIQFFNGFGASGQFENVIVYGFKSRKVGAVGEGIQGLFIRNYSNVPAHRDLAFVNCDIEASGNSQILHSVSHLLIWHCNFTPNTAAQGGGALLLRDDPPDSPQTVLHNFSLRNSVVSYFSNSCTVEPLVSTPAGGESWADNNHIVVGAAVGTNVTWGGTLADLFVNPVTGSYEPLTTSPLVGRVPELLIPCDVNGRVRTPPDAIGANVPAPK